MKGIFVIAVMMCVSHAAAAQNPAVSAGAKPKAGHAITKRPRPIAIPQEFSPPQEAYASFPDQSAASVPPAPSACQLRLANIAMFRPLPMLAGAGECGASDAVLLETVILSDKAKVAVTPPATLRCTMAEEIAHWIREDVAPAVTKIGAPLVGLDNFDSYECRGRNRVRGATLSEHGRANALDVRGFRLDDGRTIVLTDVNVPKDWREAIKATACARFSTVLGPGSDGNHEEHIHLDLAERRNNYKVCEWDVREPVVQAKAAPPSADTSAQGDAQTDAQAAPQSAPAEPQAEQVALIPLELVPLPRPRPAHIAKPAPRPDAHRSSLDRPIAVAPK